MVLAGAAYCEGCVLPLPLRLIKFSRLKILLSVTCFPSTFLFPALWTGISKLLILLACISLLRPAAFFFTSGELYLDKFFFTLDCAAMSE